MTEHGKTSDPVPAELAAPAVKDNKPEETIDIELLIAEVNKRPSLHDSAQSNSEKEAAQKYWEEVCQALFKDWDKYCPQKKEVLEMEAKRKWKTLKELFLKGYVRRPVPAQAKKRRQRLQSVSVAPPADVDMDMSAYASNNNNDEAFSPLTNQNPPEETATAIHNFQQPMPSTSAQAVDFSKTDDVKKKELVIPIPKIEATQQVDENHHFVLMLKHLLSKLNPEQRYYAWMHIMEILRKATQVGMRRICVIQDELIFEGGESAHFIQHVNFAAAEHEAVIEEENVYPAPHGRPTNERGEIIYPETDEEDLNEI